MPTTYTGEVRNGLIVLDPGLSAPPEGTKVRIELIPADAVTPARPPLLELIETLEAMPGDSEWPADAATQHDHYLYGSPKRP